MFMISKAERIKQLLTGRGLRPTRARLLILSLLIGDENHLNTDEIISRLAKQSGKVSAATVYQNLAALAEEGLLHRFMGADGLIHYDTNLEPHHHLICKKCGRILDVAIEGSLASRLDPRDHRTGKKPAGWRVEEIQLQFKSLCPACRH